jgi:hypothetical protein
METRHFDYDPFAQATETFYFDHTDDTFIIDRVVDVEPVMEFNKALANATPDRWQGDWHHVAKIPDVVMANLAKQGIVTAAGRILDLPKFKAWLNDRENQAWRTRPGRV